jgi:hypothetical protein
MVSKTAADAGVDEEPRGLVVEAPAQPKADFEVATHQVVQAGTEVVDHEIPVATLGKEPEILTVNRPSFRERRFDDKRWGSDIETVPLLTVGTVAHCRVGFPTIGEPPPRDIGRDK